MSRPASQCVEQTGKKKNRQDNRDIPSLEHNDEV